MTEFRDYSTYLQRIVNLEKKAHNHCSNKQYLDAWRTVIQIRQEADSLALWLEHNAG